MSSSISLLGVGLPLLLEPGAHPKAPAGWWARASAQQDDLVSELRAGAADRSNQASLERVLGARWRQLGLSPDEVAATVVWPIHNEAQSLDSTLRAAFASHVPSSAGLLFLLVCNACTDTSEIAVARVLDDLQCVGFAPEADIVVRRIRSAAPEAEVRQVLRRNRLTLAWLSTQVPGKSHVLNLANRIARSQRHPVVVSFDADLWLEPGTLGSFLATICEIRSRTPKDAVAFFGQVEAPIPVRTSWFNGWTRRSRGPHQPGIVRRDGCPGWIMAWDTQFLEREGGFWLTALVDNQLGGRAHMRGHTIHYSHARIWGWGYNAASEPADWVRLRIRMTRGYYQNLRACKGDPNYPEFVRFFRQQSDLTAPWRHRIDRLRAGTRARGWRSLFLLARFGMVEAVHLAGWMACRWKPVNPTWSVIRSTKG